MKPDRPSRTAEVTAAVRAWHNQQHHPPIFPDPFAQRLVSPVWGFVSRSRLASWLVFDQILRGLQPVAAHIIGRARYVEDRLAELRQEGLGQYVLVGAGLDSIGLRNAIEANPLRVFEVDHPATQETKRQRLERANGGLPAGLELVPVDFERECLTEGLRRSSFDPKEPALFAWLGVVQYLSEEAVDQTLAAIRESGPPGSELIFDYIAPRQSTPEADRDLLDGLSRFTARRGEPLKATYDPQSLGARLGPLGFDVRKNLSPEEQGRRYFQGYSDSFRPPGFYHIARLGWGDPPKAGAAQPS